MAVWRHASNVGTLVLSGVGALDALRDELNKRGYSRAFLISSPSARRGGAMQALTDAVPDIDVSGSFTTVRQHVPEDDIHAAAAALKEADPDFVLAIGGASVGDAAKGAVLLHSGSGFQTDLSGLEPGTPPLPRLLPIVNIPLTLAGAEFLSGGAFNRDGHKDGFVAPGLAHAITVYDPRCLADIPAQILCTSGFNGLAHALESSLTDRATPYSRALAAASASRFARYLPARASGDVSDEVLVGLSEAAVLGSLAYVIGMAGVHHAICHALGGVFGIPHASANTAILPFALAANEESSKHAQEELAAAMRPELQARGVPTGLSLPECVEALKVMIGADDLSRGLGLSSDDLDVVATEVMRETSDGSTLSPRALSKDQVRSILEAAVTGDLQRARL